jgi:hypothetical protein
MSKYRIVKHQADDTIGYCPEVCEAVYLHGESHTMWVGLAGNTNLTYLNAWVGSLPQTIDEAKEIIKMHIIKMHTIKMHIKDSKPRYTEEVHWEYDTENPTGIH